MMSIKGDLHIHSTISDGKHSPKEIIVTSLEKGLNVISITDHDSFRGSILAANYANALRLEVVVVIGAEIRTTAGDLLVYCIEDPLEKIPRDPLELVDIAHQNNCIIVAAHPFDIHRKGIGELVYSINVDAIEVFNARSPTNSNRRAYEAAKLRNLPGIANSDAHVIDEIGSAYTIYEVNDLTPEEVLRAIIEHRVIPKPGRPSIRALVSHALWSIERSFKKKGKHYQDQFIYEEDYILNMGGEDESGY